MRLKHFLSVFLTLLTLSVGQMWGAQLTYTHDFTTKPATGDNTLSTITWTVSNTSNLNGFQDGYKGVQVGAKNKNGSITLTTKNNWGAQASTSYNGYTNVKKVYVWLNAGTATPSATVTIGGTAATSNGATVSKNTSATGQRNGTSKVTFTPATGHNTGAIAITVTTSSGAGYLCSIEVECEQPASGPSITTQPTGANYLQGAAATALSIAATASSGTLSYQWKSNTTNSTSGATNVGTGTTYTPSTGTVGTKYYFCVVTDGSGSTTSDIVAVTVTEPTGTFNKLTGSTFEEGDYVIYASTYAMKNTVTSSRFDPVSVTPVNNTISNPDKSLIWHIAPSETEGYWTIYSADASKYAGGSTTNNAATLLNDASTDYALWSISVSSGTATIANKGRGSDRHLLQLNSSTYKWGLFTSGQTSPNLYKKAPTKATLTFDLNGKTLSSGTKPSNVTNVTLNQAYDLSSLNSASLTATGYTFAGWNTSNSAASSQSSITPTEATTYTLYAVWTANTNTAYTVKHYKQNLDGTYPSSPTETDNLTGTTDASVTPARKSYTGFTAPSGQTVTILADGSRIVTYNYTRNSYSLTWSTDGDELTGSYTKGSTKFGAAITAPNTPTKTGYVFDAWSSTPAATMPASNTTYTATWTCKVPEIGTDLSTAQVDYIEDAAATALSISASANGASLSYAWEQSANGTSGWSSVGTNSSSYTPSTAEEGDLYYRCTVTNAVAAGCSSATATSKVAHIHVVAASVCLTPSFSPAAGTHVGSQNVTISSTDGATIYYTTDGSDPKVSGTRSTYSSAIAVSVNTTIRAYAEKAEMTASAEGSAAFTIKCADPTFSPAGGSYTSAQSVSLASDYGTVYYTTDGSDPATYGTAYSTPIAVSTTNTTIKAIAKKANCANSDMETASYTISCATPTFSPTAGNIISGQAITLNCATEGATMYYTMGADPATPTTASAQYDPENKPVVSSATTIKVIAVKDGWSNSAVASADYAVKYTVTLNAGTGSISADGWSAAGEGIWTKAQASVGGSITLPNATLSSTLTEAGWSFSGWKTTSAVTTQTDVKPSYVATSYTPTSDITLYAVYVKTSESTIVDELTRETTGVADQTGGSVAYTAWEDKTATSDAVYAGSSAANYNSIQLRSDGTKAANGIITTASGGKAKKVTIAWNSNTGTPRTITVYGKNTAYEEIADLRDNSKQGSSLGTIVRGTSTELTISGDYEYIGICSTDGAMFLDEVDVEWNAVSKSYYSNPSDKVTLTYHANGATDGEAPAAVSNITIGSNQTVAAKPALLAKTGYSFGGWNTKDDGTGTNYVAGTGVITMNDNTTLYAKWTINKHKVSVSAVDNGTITATPAGASAIAEGGNNAEVAYGTVVTLAQTNDTHYSFGSWSVTAGGNAVTVTNNQFTMPDADVTVSATFTENAYRMVKYYSNGGDPISSEKVYVGETPANAPTPVYEDCLEGSNRFYGWTTAEWVGAINASTLAGKTVYTGALPDVAAGAGDVNYYAVWAKATTTFQKGTSADLTNGQKVVIVNRATSKALETDGTWDGSDVTISTNQISNPASGIQWTIETTTGGYYLNNGSNQYLKGQNPSGGPYIALANTTTKWTLTNDGTYVLKDANNRYLEYYNSAFTTFGSYNSNNANNYVMDFYVPVLGEFRTNCCALKPVTNVQVGTVTASSVTLTWTAPSSTTGITKLQIINADNGNVLTDNISASATSGTVSSGLTECESINLKVVSFGSECSSNSAVIAAIPQADAKTVTFNYNGGTGSPSSATTPCGETSVDLPSTPTRDGYRFKGWNDGTTTLAVNATTYTPAANVTLTAQWAQLYTVQYNFDGATYGEEPDDAQYEAGETVTLTNVVPNKGILAPFKAWSYSTAVTVTDGTFPMPANNLTITATYSEIVGQWILVTDESTLNEGDYVVIAAADDDYAMSTTQNNNNRGETSITKSGNVIVNPSDNVQIFTLEEGTADGSWAFKCLNGDQANNYIYPAGGTGNSPKNYLKSKDSKDADASWVLDLASESATAVGTSATNKTLRYNSNSSIFSAYASGAQSGIALYQFREGTYYNVNIPSPAPTGGSVTTNKSMAKEGETVTLTYAPSRGYTVETLTVTGASGSVAISPAVTAGVTEYTFTMPAEAVTVAASFEAVPPVDYNLVTDAADLVIGVQFLIVSNETNGYRAAATRNGEYLHAVSISNPVTNKVSITTEDVVDFVLTEKDGDNWVISSIEGKLSQSSGNMSYNGANDKWGISISEGNATISNSTYTLRYNYNGGSNPRFKTYSNTTGEIPAIYALPYTSYNFELNDCKTIKIATGYTYTYTIKNTDEPSSTPSGYEFLNKWTDGTNTYAVGDAVEVSAATTLQPCWKVTPTEDVIDADGLPEGVQEIIVGNGKDLNINDDKTYENVTVKAGGKISGDNQLTVINNLTIQTTSGAFAVTGTSGQLTGSVMPVVSGDLFIEIKLCDGDMDDEASRKWYCISAPFDVAINGGFYWGDGTPMVLNTHFQLFEWDGDRRATGASGWRRTSSNMKAGIAYFIGFDDERVGSAAGMNQNTIKLKAMSNTISNAAKIVAPAHGTSGDYANWNGMANPNFHHIALNKNVQAFDYNKQGYSPYATGEYNFVVGTPFFIQYAGDITIQALNDGKPFRAPQRESETYSYCVRIGSADASRADNQIYVRASETASAEFDNEHDMITLNNTTSNYGALLWTENYGGKRLAIEDAPFVGDKATYALSLYAPADGTYRIETPTVREDADLYLTYEGSIIWNLSAGAYEVELGKGATNEYGLMIVRKAPQVTTGIETVTGYGLQVTGVQKIVINDHVYILREGQLYDVTGKAVK